MLVAHDVFCSSADSSEDIVGEFCLVLFGGHFVDCPECGVDEYVDHVSVCPLSNG